MASRTELNFKKLLIRCETMAKDRSSGDWRFEKYVETLQDLLGEMKRSRVSRPPQESLDEYSEKVKNLREMMESDKGTLAMDKKLPEERQSNSRLSLVQDQARYHRDEREELLGGKQMDSELRHRNVTNSSDTETMIRHQRGMHEKLTEQMLNLTRSLKESVRDSGKIVQEDNKTLETSMKLADSNTKRLKVESDRLEQHTKTCSWWIWVMLVFVTLTFLSMIVFMRMFGKKAS
ncbi:vesicle transport protein USE1-like isoform X2 [Ostrea edulis]|uniref:vesicle transport protein USE1-like isoform X2 n=1 Tax=Ostrea edulis TaxID=37623 RepID=UPI0020957AA9|nr:vesicle transport protein USE1-like isoform X2 [Ostrea edulis]